MIRRGGGRLRERAGEVDGIDGEDYSPAQLRQRVGGTATDVHRESRANLKAVRDLADEIEDHCRGPRDIAISLLGLIVSVVVIIVRWETIVIGVLGGIGAVISFVALVASTADWASSALATKDSVLGAFNAVVPAWPALLASWRAHRGTAPASRLQPEDSGSSSSSRPLRVVWGA